MLNECGQLWASRAAQALDARLTNHVVDPSVNPALCNTATAVESIPQQTKAADSSGTARRDQMVFGDFNTHHP